ncbi:hypothetical protein BDD12DRAFT_830322 [Trichophaea hybrida]|nr:hypothetical protein BDD12DRAFT_830322 [Trichophaea hybrida]
MPEIVVAAAGWARCATCACCFWNGARATLVSLISYPLLANLFIGRSTSFTVLAVAKFSAVIASMPSWCISMHSCCIVFC